LQAGANGYVLKIASADQLIRQRDERGRSAGSGHHPQADVEPFKQPERTAVEALIERELDVLRLAAKGFTNKAIGVQLGISDRTVQGHLAHIFAKLQANSRTEAVMRAVSLGWIPQNAGQIAEE
jgi:DNA-binding NarL/FixJ family response regulator